MPIDRNADDLPPIPEIRCVGVIGAGQMGTGIAEVVALAGLEVRLLDISQEQLDQALHRIGMHLHRRVARSTLSNTECQAALARIQTATDYDSFRDCQLVVEAAAEDEAIKRDILKTVIGYLPKEKILVVADAFSPRAPITKTPERINPNTANLWSNISDLKLDVETVVPIHGRIVKVGELKLEAGASN